MEERSLPLFSEENEPLELIIAKYFLGGFTYEEIREFLKSYHDHNISLSTLKRHLKKMDLYRRPLAHRRSSANDLEEMVRIELLGSGSQLGYRRIWTTLRNAGLMVRRDDVRRAILDLDPEGVDHRRRRKLNRRRYRNPGPNDVWHIDGHDKMKPFGFSIHGCIDGYSRRLIWLEVSSSNKVPELIAKYYIQAVKRMKGIPRKIKADDGTEHSIIEPIHVTLRSMNGDGDALNTFSVVTSPRNQRIEAYWSKMRQDRPGWWISFFKDLVDQDLYDPSDPILLDCARYCFMDIIRNELYSVQHDWNQHIISKSRYGGPSGRPDTMYFLPHLHNSANCIKDVDLNEVEEFIDVTSREVKDFSAEFEEFATIVMTRDGLIKPDDAEGCLNLYFYFIQQIEHYL